MKNKKISIISIISLASFVLLNAPCQSMQPNERKIVLKDGQYHPLSGSKLIPPKSKSEKSEERKEGEGGNVEPIPSDTGIAQSEDGKKIVDSRGQYGLLGYKPILSSDLLEEFKSEKSEENKEGEGGDVDPIPSDIEIALSEDGKKIDILNIRNQLHSSKSFFCDFFKNGKKVRRESFVVGDKEIRIEVDNMDGYFDIHHLSKHDGCYYVSKSKKTTLPKEGEEKDTTFQTEVMYCKKTKDFSITNIYNTCIEKNGEKKNKFNISYRKDGREPSYVLMRGNLTFRGRQNEEIFVEGVARSKIPLSQEFHGDFLKFIEKMLPADNMNFSDFFKSVFVTNLIMHPSKDAPEDPLNMGFEVDVSAKIQARNDR